jgi:hypothetical protein
MANLTSIKKYIIYGLIGCLIIAAVVAVVAVLIGEINAVTGRVFATLFLAVLHSLVSLMFIWDDSRRNTFTKLAFFTNTIFVLIILSFFTSMFGVWDVIQSKYIWDLYQTYFVVAFAALHGDILSKAMRKEGYMDIVIYINYLFIVILTTMLLPIIFIDRPTIVLSELYYRFLGASAIIDGTLSILTIIFYKLYMHKHPELNNELAGSGKKKGLSIWLWILIIWLVVQIGFPLIYSSIWLFR